MNVNATAKTASTSTRTFFKTNSTAKWTINTIKGVAVRGITQMAMEQTGKVVVKGLTR